MADQVHSGAIIQQFMFFSGFLNIIFPEQGDAGIHGLQNALGRYGFGYGHKLDGVRITPGRAQAAAIRCSIVFILAAMSVSISSHLKLMAFSFFNSSNTSQSGRPMTLV